MALFRLPSSAPAALMPRGNGLLLRAPHMSDFMQWAQLRDYSRAYLTPWEPIWPSDDLTRTGFRRRLRRCPGCAHHRRRPAFDKGPRSMLHRQKRFDGDALRVHVASRRRLPQPALTGQPDPMPADSPSRQSKPSAAASRG